MMIPKNQTDKINEAIKRLGDAYWRINNLYYIKDKQGRKVIFKLNWAQQALYKDMWYCNVVLKARQLGISTFVCLLFLDRCIFNSNQSAGIIAHTLEDAQALFTRVKFAYDNLPDSVRGHISANNDTAQMLVFSNGSSLRVGTSLRSSTFQYLHISEFGKICAKYPDKAQEIVTGSLNTVAPGQYIFIESTAEGRDGYFYDICKNAQSKKPKELTKLDFKFHFFPWWKEPSYRIGSNLPIDQDMQIYFDHLTNIGIHLDMEQKAWYALRAQTQKDDMRREYPSTPEESWEVSNEGLYYGKLISIARAEKRIGYVPYDESIPVYTAWDLGFNDNTSVWYIQVSGKEIRLIDYMEGSGESLAHWIGVMKKRDYVYEKHIAPHDIMQHEYSSGMTRQSEARKLGVNFIPAQKLKILEGIDQVRNILNRCWFDQSKCALGLKCLEGYKKEWDDRHACWRSQPLHNWASHGADAFRTLATGLHYITNAGYKDSHNPDQYRKSRFG